MIEKTLLKSHNELLTIVEAYNDVYKDKFKDSLLATKLPEIINNAKTIEAFTKKKFILE